MHVELKKILFIFSLAILSLNMHGQNFSGTVRDSTSHKVLDFVSVVILNDKQQPLCFQHTNAKGEFSLAVPEGKLAARITFSMLGYNKKTFAISKYKNGQTVYLGEGVAKIREVTVKARRLQLRGDTLSYSVAGFRQKQDRSIADVIAKMPGLKVDNNGSITYQGKPINKFYIEGMDLMGGKYAMASENLSANKVAKVEVYQRHQPIKALRGKSFSDQAAINLVLTDDAKAAWTGMADVGVGAQLQKGIGQDVLRDGKITAMRFAKKSQSLSMYKWNNTGMDIKHEILDLANDTRLSDDVSGWVSGISLSTPSIAERRYTFNDTHLLATNWLAKLGKDKELRMQASYLFDNTLGKMYHQTVYTNILGKPAIEENTEASQYRNELTTELQYKVNSSKSYVNNIFRSTFEWNHSTATSHLGEEKVGQYVRPRKVYLGDEFSIYHNLSKNRSYSFSMDAAYCHLPSLLQLCDSSMQRLAVTDSKFNANTVFRHKLWGFKVSYEAALSYHRQEGKLGISRYQKVIEPEQSEYMQEVDAQLTPTVSYSNNWGLNFSAEADLQYARFDLTHDGANKFYVSPTVNVKYQITSTTDASIGYRHSYSVYPFSTHVSLPYYSDYISKLAGDGKWSDIKSDKLWGEFNFGNPLIGLFFYLKGDYSRNGNMPLFTSWLDGNVYNLKMAADKYTATTKTLNAEVSKAFGMGKLSVNIGGDALWNDYAMLVNEEENPCQGRYFSSYFKLAVMPCPQFSLEAKSTLSYSKQVNKLNSSLDSEGLRTDKHELRLYYMPGSWKFTWINSFYRCNDKDVDNAFFSDAGITYSPRRFEISVSMYNLFGTKKYEQRSLSDSYIYYSINQLRPREILCSVVYYL